MVMRIKIYRTGSSTLLSGALFLVSLAANAQFTETREFVKRFKIQPETRIDITNKYGKIELNTWDKDSVVIQFKMEINEKKPDKLAKTLANLDFDISNSQHYLVVKSPAGKEKLAWKDLARVEYGNKYVYIYIDLDSAFIIPVEMIKNGDLEKFAEQAEGMIERGL